MQLAAIIVSLVLTVVGVALLARAIGQFVRYFKLGQPVPAGSRTDNPYARSVTLVREFLGHTRMNRWGIVGFAHWFVAIGFLTLPPTIVNAYGQLFQAVTVNIREVTQKTAHFHAWTYATEENAARLRLSLDGGTTFSDHAFHTGRDQWEYQRLAITIPESATSLRGYLFVTEDEVGRFDLARLWVGPPAL